MGGVKGGGGGEGRGGGGGGGARQNRITCEPVEKEPFH